MALSLSGQLLWPRVNLSLVTQARRPSSPLLLFTTFVLVEDSNEHCRPGGGVWTFQPEIDEGWGGEKAEGWSKRSKSRRNPRRGNGRTLEWAREPTQMKGKLSINKSLEDTHTLLQERWQSRCGRQGEPPVIPEFGNIRSENWRMWRGSDEHHLVDSTFTASHLRVQCGQRASTLLGIFISHQAGLRFRVRRSLSAQTGYPFTTRLLTIKCHPEQSGV